MPAAAFKPDGHCIEMPRLWDALDPERGVAGRQLWDHVQEAIAGLPAGQRAVIILRDIEGRTAEEACARLEISPENQRVLLHRARGRVRRTIGALLAGTAPVAVAGTSPTSGRAAGGALSRLIAPLIGWLRGQVRARAQSAKRLPKTGPFLWTDASGGWWNPASPVMSTKEADHG